MILPGKHLKPDRALLGIGSEVLAELAHEQTVSELWERIQGRRDKCANPISFDWFTLSLSFLYAIDAIGYDDGVVFMRSEQ